MAYSEALTMKVNQDFFFFFFLGFKSRNVNLIIVEIYILKTVYWELLVARIHFSVPVKAF